MSTHVQAKEVARRVLHEAWKIEHDVFETMWATLARLELPLHGPFQAAYFDTRSLASGGVTLDPPTMALVGFIGVLRSHSADVLLQELLTEMDALGERLEQKGIIQRFRKTSLRLYAEDTTIAVPQIVATAYRDDGTEELTAQRRDFWLDHRAEFVIFVHQRAALPQRAIGTVYIFPDYNTAVAIPPLEYRILVQLLKHERDHRRTLADFAEHCWEDKGDAARFRDPNIPAKMKPDRRKYEVRIASLSTLLYDKIGIHVRSEGTGLWELVPWPRKYCVINEQ